MFDRFARWIAEKSGSAVAFCGAVALIAAWAMSGPLLHFSELWQLSVNTATTIITFLMVFVIQHTQNADTRALHAKLDELIRAIPAADNAYRGIEQGDAPHEPDAGRISELP
jgi:low affinity Fe/Cu permease